MQRYTTVLYIDQLLSSVRWSGFYTVDDVNFDSPLALRQSTIEVFNPILCNPIVPFGRATRCTLLGRILSMLNVPCQRLEMSRRIF